MPTCAPTTRSTISEHASRRGVDKLITLEYRSNNSGGSWWLSDDDWHKLAAANWDVKWHSDPKNVHLGKPSSDGRWLGALATRASKQFETPEEGIREWQEITGQDPSEIGCTCCGEPHNFEYRDKAGEYHYASAVITETTLQWS